MKMKTLYLSLLCLTPVCLATQLSGDEGKNKEMTHIISDYRQSLASLPLDYDLIEKKQLAGASLQRYNLTSQSWSPQNRVSPERWQHEVAIFIPDTTRKKNALVVINNGKNNDGAGNTVAATNFSEETLLRIAIATQTIVISVSNIPNQPLNYKDIPTPLEEDDSVAYSWKTFMSDPQKLQNISLHIPMSAAVSQTLRLAKSELAQHHISQFIVSGVSKRGWIAWLTALSDPDVVAVVPFAMDLLNTKKSLEHMYLSYGKNWPIAFYPYYQYQIDKSMTSDEFARLMSFEDPLAYLKTDMGKRLKIEKYVVNASGDDFYMPDNSQLYYSQLPAKKSLRVVPNSTHNGILAYTEHSLTTFVNRFQTQKKLPEIKENVHGNGHSGKVLTLTFSEKPTSVLQWTAHNPGARDFRYACGVKYVATPVTLSDKGDKLSMPLTSPGEGWQARYIEATFDDGYVATSQVYITPDTKYPKSAPPSVGAACKTLPGRTPVNP